MYRRFNIFKVFRINYIRYRSTFNEQIFFDYRKRFVHHDLLSNVIEKIDSNISEKHSLLILTAAARYIHHVTPEKRVQLLEEAWKTLNDKNVRLTTRHYETYLSGLNENGFRFDSDYYLKLIDKEHIQATPRLYTLLLNQYCRDGQIDRAEDFLRILKDRHINLDENIFAGLIVCQLKLGNTQNANDIIELMKERHSPPTISTYQEILTLLISEHKFEEFQNYFSQIDVEQTLISTLYIDTQFLLILLGQCVSYKCESIFDLLLIKLKDFDYKHLGYHLFNLSIQCLANQWYKYSIELLNMQSNNLHGKHWILFFQHLFNNNQMNLIEIFIKLMKEKQMNPLDAILRAYYTDINSDYRLALNYLEQGGDNLRINYLYPLLINAYSSQYWTDDDRLRLFRLFNRFSIPIDGFICSNYFHRYYKNDYQSLFNLLSTNHLQSFLDRICRLLLNDIQHKTLPLNIIKQIAPYFRLHSYNRQEELARHLMLSIDDTTEIFDLIDSISENPMIKRSLYTYLLGFSVQYDRKDLTIHLAEQCVKEEIKIDRSINDIHSLTDHVLPDDLVERLSRYKPDELSWKEKLSKILINKTDQSELEEIYSNAKQDERYPISLQQRLLEIYVHKQLIDQALSIFKEIDAERYKIDSSIYHRLFDLMISKSDAIENIRFLTDLYEKSFGIVNLPSELTFRLARLYITNNDETTAIKLIDDKIKSNLNNEILQYLIKFLENSSSVLTADGFITIGNMFLDYRPNESIRQFWNIFFDLLLKQTTPIKTIQFYSNAIKRNSNIPYLHLFQLFIEKDQYNYLQDIVDIATVHHGSQNVLHDLGFVLIENGKIKQAERIFQTSWLRAKNERINLHALFFADSNNLRALMSAINLTRNLPGVNQKQLFTSAIRVAIRLEKSDTIDWLVQDIQENNIQIDIRVKKFLDARLLSKGLDRLNIDDCTK